MCGSPSDRGLYCYVPATVLEHLFREAEFTGAGVEDVGGTLLIQGLYFALLAAHNYSGAEIVHQMIEHRLQTIHPAESRSWAEIAISMASVEP